MVYAYAESAAALEYLQSKRQNQSRNSRSAFKQLAPEVITDPKKIEALYPRIAFRDVTNSVDYRTVISALIPAGTLLTNMAPYLLRVRGNADHEAFMLAVLCSLPLDWVARKFVVLHLNFHILNSLPIPILAEEDPRFRRIVSLVAGLVAFSNRSPEWVSQLSQTQVTLKTHEDKEAAIAELDALVSSAYGLNEEDISHIFATFHKTWDYSKRLSDVIGHFRKADFS